MRVVDLGCGTNKRRGAIGMDNAALPGVDVVHSLLDWPYPFESGSVDRAILSHVLEHFTIEQGGAILGEVYRILRPGGLLEINVPHAFSVAAWVDPTHRRFFTFDSAIFYSRQSAKAYYQETDSLWDLVQTRAAVTPLNWKRYRLRRLDARLGRALARLLNGLLHQADFPGSADLLVKALPLYFVNVQWILRKPDAG